jgi:hypothetical protein
MVALPLIGVNTPMPPFGNSRKLTPLNATISQSALVMMDQ